MLKKPLNYAPRHFSITVSVKCSFLSQVKLIVVMTLVKCLILLLTNGFTVKQGLFTKMMLLNKRYVENNLIGCVKVVGGYWKLGDKVQGHVGRYVVGSSQSLITCCV